MVHVSWCHQHVQWLSYKRSNSFSLMSPALLSCFKWMQNPWLQKTRKAFHGCLYTRGGSLQRQLSRGLRWLQQKGRNPFTLTSLWCYDEIVRPLTKPTLQIVGNTKVLQDDKTFPCSVCATDNWHQQHEMVQMEWPAGSLNLVHVQHL